MSPYEGDGDIEQERTERLVVLNQVEMGKMIGREAAKVLALSLRHVRRLVAAYRREGAVALAHGNRGRKSHHALDVSLRQCALELAVEHPYHQARSLLRYEIGDEISYRTIHCWAQEGGRELREEGEG